MTTLLCRAYVAIKLSWIETGNIGIYSPFGPMDKSFSLRETTTVCTFILKRIDCSNFFQTTITLKRSEIRQIWTQ